MEEIIFGTYKKSADGRNCLVLGKNRDSYEERMLRETKPSGFLKLLQQERENYVYDITGKKALPAAFERVPMNGEQLIKIVTGILIAMEQAGEYLLNSESFVLLPEYIFLELPEYEVRLCYYPEYHVPVFRQLSKLLETFLNRVDYREKQAISLVYSLYMLLQEPDVTLEKMKARLLEETRPRRYGRRATVGNRAEEKGRQGRGEREERSWQDRGEREAGSWQGRGEKEGRSRQDRGEREARSWQGRGEKEGRSWQDRGEREAGSWQGRGEKEGRSRQDRGEREARSWQGRGEKEGKGRQDRGERETRGWQDRRELGGKKKEGKERKKGFLEALFSRNEAVAEPMDGLTDEPEFYGDYGNSPAMVAETPSEWGQHTRVLSVSEMKEEPSLVAERNGETVYLHKFPFFIGSVPEYSDFVIEQDTVSRFHAKLVQADGEVVLFDLNSTNGTTVNETEIPPQQGIRLHNGDRIAFAGEGYRFYYGGKKQP